MRRNKKNDDLLSQQVAELLRLLRIEKGLFQEELSQKVGQSASYVSRVETGKHTITLLTLDNYLKALDVSFIEFFTLLEKHKKKDE